MDPVFIDAALAVDGIDKILHVFAPATYLPEYPVSSERFAVAGQLFRLEPIDHPHPITFAAHPDRFEVTGADPDVTARGTASDLFLFLWGRVPPDRLDVSGDADLLARWQDRVKI